MTKDLPSKSSWIDEEIDLNHDVSRCETAFVTGAEGQVHTGG